MADPQDQEATISVQVEKPTKRLQRHSFRKLVWNKCCCCVPLRTGCLILAYLYLVGLIMIGMYSLLAIINLVNIMSHYPEVSLKTVIITFLVLNSVNLGLALIGIPFNVLLLIGLHKERRSFVILFVRFQWAYIILNALQNIFVIIMKYTQTVQIVIGLAGLVFNIYFTLVMRSQYLKMGARVSSAPAGQLYSDGHLVMTP